MKFLRKRKWQILVSLPVALYLFYSIAWKLPQSLMQQRTVEPTKLLWSFFALDQDWPLFAPDVRTANVHINYVVTFDDGTKTIWQPTLNGYKWRKWCLYTIPWPERGDLWPDFARYIGRQLYNRIDEPRFVSLHLLSGDILPPTASGQPGAAQHETKYFTQCVYQYTKSDFP